MTRCRVTVVLALLPVAGACGEDLFGPDLGPTVGPEHEGALLELSFPDPVSAGESVPFRITLTNTGSEPHTIDDPQFDVYLMDRRGPVVWNFLYGSVIIGGAAHTVPAGERYEVE